MCYRRAMPSSDTTAEAARAQEEAYKRMGEGARFRTALELSDLTHTFALAGVKHRQPQLSDEQAREALASILYR